MNIIPYMSYWNVKSPDKFIINCHKLSAYLLRKNFGEVHLITDSESLSYFKDIRWTSISTDLDILDKKYASIWSLGKIYTYKILAEKKIPFIHVDYDVFLWEGLPNKIKNSTLFSQNFEINKIKTYDKYHIKDFINNCPDLDIFNIIKEKDYLNDECEIYKNINALNMGIFGGTDLDFIAEYSNKSMNFIYNKKNEVFWLEKDVFEDWRKSCIVEQYYISFLLKLKNKKINLFFDKDINIKNKGSYWIDLYYNGFNFNIDQEDYPYTHLVNSKKRPDIKDKINKLVKKLKL